MSDTIYVKAIKKNLDLKRILIVGVILLLSACAGNKPYVIELMPSPDVYDDGAIDPFADTGEVLDLPYDGILYATDRLPAGDSDESLFYRNERGQFLRLGIAEVKTVGVEMSWEEARRISLAKTRSQKYPIRVSGAHEYGILDRTAASCDAGTRLSGRFRQIILNDCGLPS